MQTLRRGEEIVELDQANTIYRRSMYDLFANRKNGGFRSVTADDTTLMLLQNAEEVLCRYKLCQ